MVTRQASWLIEEPALDEPADLLTLPEIRQILGHDPHDDELGLRSLLEAPEAPPAPWWDEPPDRHLGRRSRRRRATLATAA